MKFGFKNLNNAKLEDVFDEPILEPVISDAMLKRDNFFHSCWMMLKHRNPNWMKEMADVELLISGYDPEVVSETNEPEEEVRTVL